MVKNDDKGATRLDETLEYILSQTTLPSDNAGWYLRRFNQAIARAKKLEDLASALRDVVSEN